MRVRHRQSWPRMILCMIWLVAIVATTAGEEFSQSLKGRAYDAKQFKPTGANTSKAMKPDAQGLRITMPADHNSKLPVGIVPHLVVRGDFEITLAFEILRIDKPTAGHGAGVSLYITMVSPTQEAATIGRWVGPKGEHVFKTHHATTPPDGKRIHHGSEPSATESLSGQLRLARSGSVLSYQVAQGDSKSFQELEQVEFGDDDLDLVRFAADNGGSSTLVDVRIKSINIKAAEFPAVPGKPPPPRPRWPYWLAGGLAVFGLTVGCVWFWSFAKSNSRRQKPAATKATTAVSKG